MRLYQDDCPCQCLSVSLMNSIDSYNPGSHTFASIRAHFLSWVTDSFRMPSAQTTWKVSSGRITSDSLIHEFRSCHYSHTTLLHVWTGKAEIGKTEIMMKQSMLPLSHAENKQNRTITTNKNKLKWGGEGGIETKKR